MKEDIPQIRKVGRYLFYAICALGVSMIVYAGCYWLELPSWFRQNAANLAMIVSFLALRDIDKNARAEPLS